MSTADEPWTVGRLLKWTVDYLGKHGAENPRLDAEVLLAEARGCRRIDLYASYAEIADEKVRTAYRELVKRRAEGAPVAYLVGRREFYSLEFEVTPDVLIPRPETELVVVAMLDFVRKFRAGSGGQGDAARNPHPGPLPQGEGVIQIADVGTGSGILAVCAAKFVPNAQVTAIDISPTALAVARRNATKHGVAERIEFVESDLFASVRSEELFDVVASNPPYVSTSEMAELAADVRSHEPRVALEAGERGTDVITPLVEQSGARLKPGGALLIEISPMIAAEVEKLVRDRAELELGVTIRDLAGHARVVQATRSS
jgi:release factor glutamine methyltransferase